jgi:hypothetical protein
MNNERADTKMVKRIPQVLKKRSKKAKEGQEFTIWLDQDSVERMERLKEILKSLDDNTLMAFALKSLERETHRIIMKRVLRKIRALEKQGFNSQQIADHLNKQGFPVPRQGYQWDAGTIESLSNESSL